MASITPLSEIACFAAPGLVLACTTEDENDENFPVFRANLERLRAATDARGRSLDVVELPTPRRRDRSDGERLTLSYVNCYIANGGVVIPDFEDDQDDRAFRQFREVFPDLQLAGLQLRAVLAHRGPAKTAQTGGKVGPKKRRARAPHPRRAGPHWGEVER